MGAHQTVQTQAPARPAFTSVPQGVLQRTCACGQHTGSGGECEECKKNQTGRIQHHAANSSQSHAMGAVMHEAVHPPKHPLDVEAPEFIAPNFTDDFSQMAIHFDGQHQIRQMKIQAKLAVSRPGDEYEREADRVADLVMGRSGPEDQESQPDRLLSSRRQPGNLTTPSHPGASLYRALGSSGQPLEPAARSFMESRFGHDFRHVRVHVDTAAVVMASNLNARAFTIGQDIVFGSGQHAPATQEGKRLLAHELTHTIQQGGGASNPVVQRDAIDDVREKLSYGFLDWAITDSEAMEALALLGSIPAANLAGGLARLGSKYITRLLDNLPDAAKTGDLYKRLVEALGSGGVLPYAQEQLSYGLFDWAITDAEVTRIFNTFVNLPAAAQEQFLADLSASGRLGRLISNANTGHHALYIRPWIGTLPRGRLAPRQRTILRIIVAEASSDAVETLKLATETRFDVTVGRTTIPNETAEEWDASHLREVYLVLDELPEAHVARNRELLRFGQFREAAKNGFLKAGVYSPARQELAINIEASDIRDDIVHETGHAIDREMGWSVGPEPANPLRGGWRIYRANYHDCATDMVDDSGGAIRNSLSAPQRGDVVDEMATAMGNRSARGLEGQIRGLPWFGGLVAATRNAVLADRSFEALEIGLKEPWFNAEGGGEHLGAHVYQEGYPNKWVRYRHEARSRMLTRYQFRDEREWFAEAYSFYYKPDPRGRGAKLADKDRDTKNYFDANVHTRAPSR